jgi:hypothetical protein
MDRIPGQRNSWAHQNAGAGAMLSVTVRIRAAEFSTKILEIGEWLRANQWEPTRYQYIHHEGAVRVTLDFPAELAAEVFVTRFNGVYRSSPPNIPPPVV